MLRYDISKAVDPTQPFAAYLRSLLNPTNHTAFPDFELRVDGSNRVFEIHRFILAARAPVFASLFQSRWKNKRSARLTHVTDEASIDALLVWIYSGEITDDSSELCELARRLDLLEPLNKLLEALSGGRTLLRERRKEQTLLLQGQFTHFTINHILANAQRGTKADDMRKAAQALSLFGYCDAVLQVKGETLYPIHRAILCRAEYFQTLFLFSHENSNVDTDQLPIINLPFSPDVAELVISFLYTDRVDIPHENALDVLHAADFLLLPRLKNLAAIAISDPTSSSTDASLNMYDVLRAAWATNTQRLEYTTNPTAFKLSNLAK